MYDSVTGTAFGPIFCGQISEDGTRMYGPDGDAWERCASFIRYCYDHGGDPRRMTDGLLQKMQSDWSMQVHELQSDL